MDDKENYKILLDRYNLCETCWKIEENNTMKMYDNARDRGGEDDQY